MANLKKLKRLTIPDLKSLHIKIGREGQLKRSWPVAPGEFFRIYKDDPLCLTVEFLEKHNHPHPKVVLYTDLLCKTDNWSEIEFKQVKSGIFSISVKPKSCGIFQFKIKHSPDNGKTWFWDRVPFTKVIVDPAKTRDIRMYTLIPTASGTIKNWITALDHIKNLGFNMVHLLPVTSLDQSESPYAAFDLFSIDESYLDPADTRDGLEQFEDFVKVAHEKGLGLCMDLVLNHIGITSLMAGLAPEWITPDKNEPDGLMRTGCWHMNKWIKWGDLVKINYDVPEVSVRKALWDYMKQYALFFANYAAYTGGMIRLDNLHSSHHGFMTDLISALRKDYPDLVIQAEYFSDSNTLLKTASELELNLLLANPWEHPYAEDLRDYLKYLHDISTKLHFLNPLTTHDTGTPAQLYGSPYAAVPRYFAVTLMGTGETGIVQGTEHGALERINFIGRSRPSPMPMPDYFNDRLMKINLLHSQHQVFHEGGNIKFVDKNHGAVLAAVREEKDEKGERFLLISNMDTSHPHIIRIDCSDLLNQAERVILKEAFSDSIIAVQGDSIEIEVEECGIRAYWIEIG